jgi:hypothetical protein
LTKPRKAPERKALSAQDRRSFCGSASARHRRLWTRRCCETLGFRHLQLAPLGHKVAIGDPHGLSYNNYQYFNLIYRQAGKKMIMISYFSIALIVFLVWFKSFWNDTATSKKDVISWIVLIMGPLFWPVVVPLSLLQITSKNSVVKTAQVRSRILINCGSNWLHT